MGNVNFRYAERKDIHLIFEFIKALADYEHMLDEVVADEKTLEEWLFDKQKAEVIFALEGEKEVGFALFFHNFQRFSDVREFTLRICLSSPITGARATERRFCKSSLRLQLNVAAADLNGCVLTGTSRA